MLNIPSYSDERFLMSCAFCGGSTGTRDHCPSRVFLDEPYPTDLPVVPACAECNNGFSKDEEYLACLISCTLVGSTDPDLVEREKTRRILRAKPALRARLEQGRRTTASGVQFLPETDRVLSVIGKLARGHVLHELGESCHEAPTEIVVRPLCTLTEEETTWFECPGVAPMWPEVGSRAMQRIAMNGGVAPWVCVQEDRYRFHANASASVELRIVLHEYLAAYCRWEH